MNKFITVLETIGKDALYDVEKILPFATAAEKYVTAANPAVGALYSLTVGVVTEIEQKFSALGKQNGTGAQKSAEALQILEPTILKAFNSSDSGVAQNFIDGVVAMLNVPVSLAAAKA